MIEKEGEQVPKEESPEPSPFSPADQDLVNRVMHQESFGGQIRPADLVTPKEFRQVREEEERHYQRQIQKKHHRRR